MREQRSLWRTIIVLCSTLVCVEYLPAENLEKELKDSAEALLQQADPVVRKAVLSREPDGKSAICSLPEPVGLDLKERASWNRELAACLRATARGVKAQAAAGGESVLKAELLAAELQEKAAAADGQDRMRTAEHNFLGYKWGIGFGASYSFDEIIDDATVVNGIVRANKEKTLLPRAILEFHRLFFAKDQKSGERITRAHGPFAAVTAKSDDLIAGFGLGWMIGWRDTKVPAEDSGFTIGLGIILDGEVKTLADGFKEDEPLPSGESSIRFKEETRPAALLLVTRTF